MSPTRVARLEQLGFTWDVSSDAFEEYFALLSRFISREGHALVPQAHLESGEKLGVWANNTRRRRKKLSADQVKRLEEIGFSWSPMEAVFERNLTLLELYVARKGHARVPAKHMEGKVKLGSWVSNLRSRKSNCSPEEIFRLEKIGFIWDAESDLFDQRIGLLEAFVTREGHARVPQKHLESGQKLGQWLSHIRLSHAPLRPDWYAALKRLGVELSPERQKRNR
jgi:hypothetical protein